MLQPHSLIALAYAALLLAGMVFQPVSAESPLLTKVRAGENVKVVLLGTSLTQAGTWPDSLQTWLTSESPGPGTVSVVNLAASGKASNYGVSTETPAALLQHPDAVFIEFSMNDAATSLNITQQQSLDNLNWMIDQFKNQNPNVFIVLQTMNNVAADTTPYSPRPQLAAYYQIYRDVAAVRGAILIDHYPNWHYLYNNNLATWNSYMKDAVHPNALGQNTVLMPELRRVLGSEPDNTPPTLASADIVDDKSGSPLSTSTLATYTVTFSEDMNAATVDAGDFSNAGMSTITVGAISEVSPGVFTVKVTPSTLGTLQLQVNAGAVLTDAAGNPLVTTSAIADDTILTINSINAAPVWSSNPLTKTSATQGSAYESTLAGDASDTDSNPLTYAKDSGPAWLTVAGNGVLSGTPSTSDVGANSFTVSVTDGLAAPVQATLNILVIGVSPPPAGNVLVAWDDWLNLSGSNTAPDDIGVTGFTANVVSSRNLANASYGSTDGTYGSGVSGANTSSIRALLPNSTSPITTITLTNNTDADYSIDSLHFDFVQRYNAARDITVTYQSGGLGPASTQIHSGAYATITDASTVVFHNYDLDLSTILSDTVLANGESATFQITLSNFASTNSSFIDNLAIQGSVSANELKSQISSFAYDPTTGACVISIHGLANTVYKLVEASDLDFTTPDQDPIQLERASVGSLEGNTIITTASGEAIVEFNLDTNKKATFIRSEIVP